MSKAEIESRLEFPLVHLMNKNRKSRHLIKRFIKQCIPKSSCFHNLLSTRYRKDIIQQQTKAYICGNLGSHFMLSLREYEELYINNCQCQ
jgi:hypothetical protein